MLIWSLRTGPTEGAAAEGIPPSDTGLYRGNFPRKLGPRCPQGAFHTEVERLGANTPLAPPAVGLTGPSGRLEPAPLCPARKNPGGGIWAASEPEAWGPPEGAVAGTQGFSGVGVGPSSRPKAAAVASLPGGIREPRGPKCKQEAGSKGQEREAVSSGTGVGGAVVSENGDGF